MSKQDFTVCDSPMAYTILASSAIFDVEIFPRSAEFGYTAKQHYYGHSNPMHIVLGS